MDSVSDRDDFFGRACSLVYDWLSQEEKMELYDELVTEGIRSIDDLKPDMRFLRLLQFIEVRYVKMQERIENVFLAVESVNSRNSDSKIEDLVFEDAKNETSSLREFLQTLKIAEPLLSFKRLLDQLHLQEEYESYLNAVKEKWVER